MNLWATVAQASVYSIVSISVGMYYKRAIKRDRDKLDRLVSGVEAVFGISTPEQKAVPMFDVNQYRKAFAAGFGVLLIGVLTWLSSDGVLSALLEPVVPDALKPLVGILAGGIATVVAVVRTKNHPAVNPVVEQPLTPFVPVRVSTNTAETSIVPLLPAPEMSYM